MAGYTYESIRKKYGEDAELNKQLENKLSTNNTVHQKSAQTITDMFNQQIEETNAAYDDEARENAVQKKVNELYIAEEMANMGLTNSGLNRTQITANQLSYSNQKAEISRQRQSMVDKLTLEMKSYLAENENARLSQEQEIRNTDSQYRDSLALNEFTTRTEADTARYEAEQQRLVDEAKYNAEVQKKAIDAETTRQKNYYSFLENQAEQQKKSSYIIKQNDGTLSKTMQGSFEDNGISVKAEYDEEGILTGYTYVDNNSGKKSYFALGVNPFTGTKNKDISNGVNTASNGYQPNNVNGKKLSVVNGAKISVNGNTQSVWFGNGTYYYWDGRNNKYQELTTSEKIAVGIYRGRR